MGGLHPVVVRLRAERIERLLGQEKLAASFGAAQNQLSQLEVGGTDPTLTTLTKWANALGFDIVLRRNVNRWD